MVVSVACALPNTAICEFKIQRYSQEFLCQKLLRKANVKTFNVVRATYLAQTLLSLREQRIYKLDKKGKYKLD